MKRRKGSRHAKTVTGRATRIINAPTAQPRISTSERNSSSLLTNSPSVRNITICISQVKQLDPASAGGAEIRLSVGYGGRRVDLTVASDGSVVSPIPGIRGASRAGLTPAGVPGRATEIAVPLAALQARPGDTLRFNATVRSGAVEDGFTAAMDDPETWMRIELK